jgi:hypothetical protein
MLKTLAFTLAMGALSALLVADAGALPLAQAKQTIVHSDTVLVRDGCGPGMRFSRRLRRCVVAGPAGPNIHEAIRPERCGPSRHWSVRRGHCVRN